MHSRSSGEAHLSPPRDVLPSKLFENVWEQNHCHTFPALSCPIRLCLDYLALLCKVYPRNAAALKSCLQPKKGQAMCTQRIANKNDLSLSLSIPFKVNDLRTTNSRFVWVNM